MEDKKVSIDDILEVLADPTIVPNLQQERGVLAERMAKIDKMLAFLVPAGPQPVSSVASTDEATIARVRQCFQLKTHAYRTRDITIACGMDRNAVYPVLVALRHRGDIVSNGVRGSGARWHLVK